MLICPRRSVLFMPGSNKRAIEKAKTLNADSIVFDLEDAVAPEIKDIARQQIIEAIHQGGYGDKELIVRVNHVNTPQGQEDITAMANSGADAICLPKVESVDELILASKVMADAGAPSSMALWAMIETPKGVLQVNTIAQYKKLSVLAMGTSDLTKDLRARHTPERSALITSLSLCILAARANDVEILDGVYLDLSDDEGFSNCCDQGRDLGFGGKTLIHPKQLVDANRAFGPSEAEIEHAEKVLSAWKLAEDESKAVAVVDDKLIEILHVEEANRLLALAKTINKS